VRFELCVIGRLLISSFGLLIEPAAPARGRVIFGIFLFIFAK
jgi:hypothetical protein